MNWQRAERNVRSKNILMSVSSKNLITLSGQKVSQCQLSIVQPDWPQWLWIWTLQLLKLYCGRGKICPPRAMNAVLFALDCKCWNWLCWTRTPLSGLLVLMEVALSTILLISSGETSSNCDIFFTDDAAKKIFPTSKNSPSVFPYLVKLNDNGSYDGLREPIRKLENHYPELKIY